MGSPRRKPGLLGPQVEGYQAWLAHRGYTPQTIRNMLNDLGHLGRWMSGEGLAPAKLDEDGWRRSSRPGKRPAAGGRRGRVPCCRC